MHKRPSRHRAHGGQVLVARTVAKVMVIAIAIVMVIEDGCKNQA